MTETQGKKDDYAKSESGGGTRDTIWPPYHWIQSDIEEILEEFWEATYEEQDLEQYRRFIRMLQLRSEGCRDSEIARRLETNNVAKYLSGEKKCFATHLRLERDRLGAPRDGFKWLPLRLKPRGTPDEEWIQVPAPIRSFQDIVTALEQQEPTEDAHSEMKNFGYGSREELDNDRTNLFGFFLGVMLGDASKPLKSTTRFPSMTVSLTLSKGKSNSLRFGEFTSLCANTSPALAMHRIADAPSSEKRFTDEECYRWITPASPIIAWVFRSCMGLKGGERTTYDPLRMDWLLDAPREFKVHFLQGLAESDGWVDAGKDRAIIVSSPNEDLLTRLLASLGIPASLQKQPPITRIEVRTEDALTLPIFSPRIRSNNYDNLIIMGTAKSFPPRRPLPSWFVEQIQPMLADVTNYSQVCLKIARLTGYKITSSTAKLYATSDQRKTTPSPPSFLFAREF